MPFVKLDRGILDSSLWSDRDQRDIFLTAILSAEPFELKEDSPQLDIGTLDKTGFLIPAGWYGFVAMAPSGLIRRACLGLTEGYKALEKLGRIDPDSRSDEFGGRRLARIANGFVVMNYVKYREKDHTSTERVRLYRQRVKSNDSNKNETMKHENALHETLKPLHETYEDEDVYEEESKTFSLLSEASVNGSSSKGDPRHKDFKELIFKCYRYLNSEDPPWDASDAKQLSSLIKAKPDLDREKFHTWLLNYAASHDINPSDRPRKFIGKLPSYAGGSLNKFGRPDED